MQLDNLSPEQKKNLLSLAGGKLGMKPEELMAQIESGNLSQLTSRLTPAQSDQLTKVLQNPSAISQLLQNPQVAGLLQNFMKGK